MDWIPVLGATSGLLAIALVIALNKARKLKGRIATLEKDAKMFANAEAAYRFIMDTVTETAANALEKGSGLGIRRWSAHPYYELQLAKAGSDHSLVRIIVNFHDAGKELRIEKGGSSRTFPLSSMEHIVTTEIRNAQAERKLAA